MHQNNWSLAKSLEECKKKHADLCPNKGFFWQLQEYEHSVTGRLIPSCSVPDARKHGWCSVSKFKESTKDWSPALGPNHP